MMSANETECVKVWNTFFKLAHREAVRSKKLVNPNWRTKRHVFRGGTLGKKETQSLALVAWLLLALEAREGHLIQELKDGNLLTEAKTRRRLCTTSVSKRSGRYFPGWQARQRE